MKSLCRNIHLQVLVGLCFIAIVSSSEFTEDDAKEILRAHNYYRGLVDPIATNMQQMVSGCGIRLANTIAKKLVW